MLLCISIINVSQDFQASAALHKRYEILVTAATGHRMSLKGAV